MISTLEILNEYYEVEKSISRTAWVGGLPLTVTKNDIIDFFHEFQPISCKLIKPKSGDPFSFILFPTAELCSRAILTKNGCQLKGVKVVVNRSFTSYDGRRLEPDEYIGTKKFPIGISSTWNLYKKWFGNKK